jgi:hypothetical protein
VSRARDAIALAEQMTNEKASLEAQLSRALRMVENMSVVKMDIDSRDMPNAQTRVPDVTVESLKVHNGELQNTIGRLNVQIDSLNIQLEDSRSADNRHKVHVSEMSAVWRG